MAMVLIKAAASTLGPVSTIIIIIITIIQLLTRHLWVG